jgi:hypothetical protein
MLERPIRYPDTAALDFTINDRTYIDLLISPWYYIKVDTVDGYWGADISAESHPVPGAHREVSGDTFRRGKTITLSGTIRARGLLELRQAQRYLQMMFWDVSGPRKLIHQTWEVDEEIYFWCKPIQDVAMVERVENDDYRTQWSVALRVDDPRTRKLSDDTFYPTFWAS